MGVNFVYLKQFLFLINKDSHLKNVTYYEIEKIVSSFNSYMGFMKHYNTFKIRKKLILYIIKHSLGVYICFNKNYSKINKISYKIR